MGTKVTKETQESSSTYLAAFDPAPFFDYETGGTLTPVSTTDPGYQDFSYFFNALFPMPNLSERELPETEEQYKNFKKKAGLTLNPYEDWIRQCFVHIQQGYRVGIPYLENKPHFVDGKNVLKPNLPPYRYRHLKNYKVNNIPVYSGTAILVRMLQKKYGSGLSPDSCNQIFDRLFKNFQADKAFIDDFTRLLSEASHELRIEQSQESPLVFDPKQNADQAASSEEISVISLKHIWGKRGSMKRTFPTLWKSWKDNLYGDGKKVDPDYAILGFPRFHEDFVNSTVHAIPGVHLNYDAPSRELLKLTSDFIVLYGYKIVPNVMNPKSKTILDAHAWMTQKKAWDLLHYWLLTYCPDILFYYYTEFSQYQANHHPAYLTIMGLLIFEKIALWMHTPIGGSKTVTWKNGVQQIQEELSAGELHHIDGGFVLEDGRSVLRPPAGTKVEVKNALGQIVGYTIYGEKLEGGYLWDDVYYTLNPETGKVIRKTTVLEDGTMLVESFDANGKSVLNLFDKSGNPITKVNLTWDPPIGDVHFQHSEVFRSDSVLALRQLWKDSHLSILGFDGFHWVNAIPEYPNLPRTDNVASLPSSEYLKHVFNFIKRYPLPKPVTPGVFEDPKYRDAFGNLFGVEMAESAWEKACDTQWYYYLIWVEANVNNYGKKGYKKPGETFDQKTPDGRTVVNQYINTGILAPYEGNEGAAKVGHILTLGLTFLFGDRWWSELYAVIKGTFVYVIQFINDHLPEIGLTLALFAVGALGAYALFQFVGEKSRHLA